MAKKMSKCRFGRVPGKCPTQLKKHVKRGPGDVDFGPLGKCQKHVKWTFWRVQNETPGTPWKMPKKCQNAILGYPKWTPQEMSKILEKCQNLKKYVKIQSKMYIPKFDQNSIKNAGEPSKICILTFFYIFRDIRKIPCYTGVGPLRP